MKVSSQIYLPTKPLFLCVAYFYSQLKCGSNSAKLLTTTGFNHMSISVWIPSKDFQIVFILWTNPQEPSHQKMFLSFLPHPLPFFPVLSNHKICATHFCDAGRIISCPGPSHVQKQQKSILTEQEAIYLQITYV